MLIPLSRFFGIQETSQFKSYFSVQIYGNTKELLSWKNKCIRWLLMDAPAHVDRKLSKRPKHQHRKIWVCQLELDLESWAWQHVDKRPIIDPLCAQHTRRLCPFTMLVGNRFMRRLKCALHWITHNDIVHLYGASKIILMMTLGELVYWWNICAWILCLFWLGFRRYMSSSF